MVENQRVGFYDNFSNEAVVQLPQFRELKCISPTFILNELERKETNKQKSRQVKYFTSGVQAVSQQEERNHQGSVFSLWPQLSQGTE